MGASCRYLIADWLCHLSYPDFAGIGNGYPYGFARDLRDCHIDPVRCYPSAHTESKRSRPFGQLLLVVYYKLVASTSAERFLVVSTFNDLNVIVGTAHRPNNRDSAEDHHNPDHRIGVGPSAVLR